MFVMLAIAGCGYEVRYPKGQSGLDPGSASYLDTDEGYHAISEYFGYKFDGAPDTEWVITFYYLSDGYTTRTAIGQIQVGVHGKRGMEPVTINPQYSREYLYAVSDDGRELLYYHVVGERDNWRALPTLREKKTGLFQYVHGRGEALLYPQGAITFGDAMLPTDAIVYRDKAVYVDGREVPLQGMTP